MDDFFSELKTMLKGDISIEAIIISQCFTRY